MSGTEQGAQAGNLAPLFLPIGAGVTCRWPPPLPRCLVATGRYRSWPLRPHASTAGGCRERASAKLQTIAARAGRCRRFPIGAGAAAPPPSGDAAAAPAEHGSLARQRAAAGAERRELSGSRVNGREACVDPIKRLMSLEC